MLPYTIDIMLVTHKRSRDMVTKVKEIIENINPDEPCDLLVTSQIGQSASINRNWGLNNMKSDIFVMMDDDITGFYPGWLTDLVQPMIDDESILISTIRCLNPDGSIGPMMCCNGIPHDTGIHDVKPCSYKKYKRFPTACIAIRKNDVRFDEGFKGSGYEDTCYGNQISQMYPDYRIVINNNCKLIHLNNMANQGGEFFEHNKKRYLKLFPDDDSAKRQQDWTG